MCFLAVIRCVSFCPFFSYRYILMCTVIVIYYDGIMLILVFSFFFFPLFFNWIYKCILLECLVCGLAILLEGISFCADEVNGLVFPVVEIGFYWKYGDS